MGQEIVHALKESGQPMPTHLFLQAGVGSMPAAMTGYFANLCGQHKPIITIVEPNRADCIFRTAKAADGKLHNVCIGIATRTLSHNPLMDFSTEDELAIELERYMAAELPEDAANGATVRQYYIVVTQNGYQHFEAGALVSDGTYKAAETAEGTVYTLTDNLTEAEYGTLTVKADKSGAILAFAEGGELELVPYSEAPVTGVMKELKTTASLMGGVVEAEFTLTFTSDGKALVRGAVAANTIEVTADWQLVAEGLPSVSFTNVSNGTIGFGWGADGSVTFTWTGDLGAAGEQSVVFSMSASELSDLQ